MLCQMVSSSRPLPAAEQSCKQITGISFKFMAFMTKGLKKISPIWFSAFRHGPCWPFGLWLARNSLGQVLLPLLTGHTPQWWSYRFCYLYWQDTLHSDGPTGFVTSTDRTHSTVMVLQVLLPLLAGHTPQWWSYRLIPLKLFGVVILHHSYFILAKASSKSPHISD